MKDDFIYYENCSITLSVDTVNDLHDMLRTINSIGLLLDEKSDFVTEMKCFKNLSLSDEYQLGFLRYFQDFRRYTFHLTCGDLLYCIINHANNQLGLYHEKLLKELSDESCDS